MNLTREVITAIDEVLSLNGRSRSFDRDTHLLGAIPEFDSMAVVALIAALEERFSITVDDDEIDGQTFVTIGSVVDYVAGKVGG